MKKIVGVGLCLMVGCSVIAKAAVLANDGIVDSIFDLESLFIEHQYTYLEVAPPSSDVFSQDYGLVIPARMESLPKKFTKRMYGVLNGDGIPVFKITLYEDSVTRQTVFVNSYDGSEIYRLDAVDGYDPLAWQRGKFQLAANEVLDPWTAWIYDPAHVAAAFTLVSHEFYETYVLLEEQRRIEAAAVIAKSIAPDKEEGGGVSIRLKQVPASVSLAGSENSMMRSSGPPAPGGGAGGGSGSGGGLTNQIVELAFTMPPGSGSYAEIFSCNNLIVGAWGVAVNRMAVTGSVEAVWADPASETAPAMFYIVNDASMDGDGDGYTDMREILLKTGTQTNVFDHVDYDHDGMHDWYEIMLFGNINQEGWQDFDGDGLDNEDEMELTTTNVTWLSDPSLYDTDGDGTHDGIESHQDYDFLDPLDPTDGDYDRDGIPNWQELQLGTEMGLWDTDGDTLSDGIELAWGTDPLIPQNMESDDDGDGLTLGDEYRHGTNPTSTDSDGDGTNDGAEVSQGSSPTNDSDDGEPPSTNDVVQLTLTVGDHSSSASEIYEMVLSGERTHRLHSGGHGNMASNTVTVKNGESYAVTLSHVGTSPQQLLNHGAPDYDYTANIELVGNNVLKIDAEAEGDPVVMLKGKHGLAIEGEKPSKMLGQHGDGSSTTAGPFAKAPLRGKISDFELIFITPSGNPVSAPDIEGKGQNQFIFTNDTLTVDFKLKTEPIQNEKVMEQIRDHVYVDVSEIEGTTLAWGKPGGALTLKGGTFDYTLEATATFAGMPDHNSGFGKKQVLIRQINNDKVGLGTFYEVFFNPTEEKSNVPFWFKYFKDGEVVAGMQGVDYVQSLSSTGSERAKYICSRNYTANGVTVGHEILLEQQSYDLLNDQLTYGTPRTMSTQLGCESVAAWLAHEFMHQDTVGLLYETVATAANIRIFALPQEDRNGERSQQIFEEEEKLLDDDEDRLIDSQEVSYNPDLSPTNPHSVDNEDNDSEIIAYAAMLEYESILVRTNDWTKGGAQW